MQEIYQEKQHNIIYKITNIINNRFYIGAHSTNKLEDGYMGSGNLIIIAIKKYGKENFKKEILFNFSTAKEMYEKEKEIVVLCEESYNLTTGGGFPILMTDEIKKKIGSATSKAQKGSGNSRAGTNWYTNGAENLSIKKGAVIPEGFDRGRDLSHINYPTRSGQSAPTYGKRSATNGEKTIYVKPGEALPPGYILGKRTQSKTRDKTNNSKATNPANFANKKREQYWVHNYIKQTPILKGLPLPEGFEYGKIPGTFMITNGIKRRRHNPRFPIPEGFEKVVNKK